MFKEFEYSSAYDSTCGEYFFTMSATGKNYSLGT